MPRAITLEGNVMTRKCSLLKCLQQVLLLTVLTAGAPYSLAQMTGKFSNDLVILDDALTATVTATGKKYQDASRLAMGKLYQLWLEFRAKNFETHAADPLFITDMKAIEARLFAASKLIDNGRLVKAHDELQTAGIQLLAVSKRHNANAMPAGY
jgi:hypothetical protein